MISRRRFLCVLAALVIAMAISADAQQPSSGARVSGVVMNTDPTPQPVRRARVTVKGTTADGRSVITDDDGRFEFIGLPQGAVTLTASKPAYLSNTYGAKAPGQPGTPIRLAAGQTIEGLRLALPRGAVLAGTIRDYTGDPLAGASVLVYRQDDVGSNGLIPFNQWVTDDRGEYRAFGLAPGAYFVMALPCLCSKGGDLIVRSSAEVDEVIRQQQQARAGVALAASQPIRSTAPASPAPKGRPVGYNGTLYPGTSFWSQATPLTLRTGEEQDGVDITLELLPAATIEGSLTNVTGDVPEMSLSLEREGPSLQALGVSMFPLLTLRPSGASTAFSFTNVAPGQYQLVARTATTRVTTGAAGLNSTPIDPASVPFLWARLEIDVTGADLSGLTLALQPALSVTGRVIFDRTSLAVPDDLSKVQVFATAYPRGGSQAGSTVPVNADGTFELRGLMPDRYTIGATVPGNGLGGWWLASAMIDGRDAVDTLVDLSAGKSLTNAALTFSDRHASLSGTLQTPSSQPAVDYFVIAFPADRALWRAGSRRMKSTRPASDGQFTFADLPPGAYQLAAVTDVTGEDWQRPAVLEEIARSSVPVTVAPGEKKTQNLRLSGGS